MSEEANRALVTAIDALPSVPAAAKPGLLKGLSYLLGGLSNYLGAWLRRPVQSVEDRTDARTVITRAIAQAAADKLSHDPEIVSAAIAHWGPADLSRQLNKMKIAKETLKELNSFAESDEEIDSERENSPPSDDFLNSFERFCSDSSDEKMQTLWARLLAGEIRRPGSFSRHTMRRLYELDSETAQLFEKVAMRTVGLVLLSDDDEFKSYELNELQTAGLLTGAGGVFNYTLKFNDEGMRR